MRPKRVALLVFGLGVLLTLDFSAAPTGSAQSLQITSPSPGGIYFPGETVTIAVSADPSVQGVAIMTQYPLPEVQPTSSANQFQLTVPVTIIPGTYNIAAVGSASGTVVYSDPFPVPVELANSPTQISTEPTIVLFSGTSQQIPLRVLGVFPNGTTDVTRAPNTFYTSNNPEVATVSTQGVVTSIAAGGTSIAVSNGSVATTIQVRVPLGNATPVYNVTAVPSSSLTTDSNGNYLMFLNLNNNGNLSLYRLTLTSAALNTTLTTSLPAPIDNLAPGTRRTTALVFPPSAGAPGSRGVVKVMGTYRGLLPVGVTSQPGALSFSFRVTLP